MKIQSSSHSTVYLETGFLGLLKLKGTAGETDVTGPLNITVGRLLKLDLENYINKRDYLITRHRNDPDTICLHLLPTADNEIKSVTILFKRQDLLNSH